MTTQPSDWAVAQAMREFRPVFRCTTWTDAEEWILNRARELDASFPPTHNARVTGMRMIDGVHVIVAEGVTGEHLLVKHEDYLRARELDASGGESEDSLLSVIRESIRNAERHPHNIYGLHLATLQRIEQALATPLAAEAGDDTRRLDWLINRKGAQVSQMASGEWCVEDDTVFAGYGDTPRAAIDAAMGAAGAGGGE